MGYRSKNLESFLDSKATQTEQDRALSYHKAAVRDANITISIVRTMMEREASTEDSDSLLQQR